MEYTVYPKITKLLHCLKCIVIQKIFGLLHCLTGVQTIMLGLFSYFAYCRIFFVCHILSVQFLLFSKFFCIIGQIKKYIYS